MQDKAKPEHRGSIQRCAPRSISKSRNQIEQFFRRMKGYRRIFSVSKKPHLLFLGFLSLAFVVKAP
jgi:hypothetical protein